MGKRHRLWRGSRTLLELKAGDAVTIGGRAELSVWADRDGNHHPRSIALVADEITTLRANQSHGAGGTAESIATRRDARTRARQPETRAGVPIRRYGELATMIDPR